MLCFWFINYGYLLFNCLNVRLNMYHARTLKPSYTSLIIYVELYSILIVYANQTVIFISVSPWFYNFRVSSTLFRHGSTIFELVLQCSAMVLKFSSWFYSVPPWFYNFRAGSIVFRHSSETSR